jgi:Type II restriction endonuclease EcoO109I
MDEIGDFVHTSVSQTLMDNQKKQEILTKAQDWFRDTIGKNHIINTKKLSNPKEFNINPFLALYLANFLTGDSTPTSIAKALIYPRALGTSITTSFGTNIQSFVTDVLSSFGSTTSGIDIEFMDSETGQRIYCQLKAGPNTINKDDVETIAGHFQGAINLGRTNKVRIALDDLVVGVIYGQNSDLSSHYRRITKQYNYPVIVGQEFWYRLTGDEHFYKDLIASIAQVSIDANYSSELDETIQKLAAHPDIIQLSEQTKPPEIQ